MNTDEFGPEAAMSYESSLAVSTISNGYPAALEVVEGGGLTTRIATTVEEIERLRPIWSLWAHCLDTDIDYYLYNLNNDSTVLSPYVIAIYEKGIPLAMLLGQVRKCRMSATIADIRIPGPKARVLEIVNSGRMGRQRTDIDKLLATLLLTAIQNGEVDILCFERLSLHSELFYELRQILDAHVPRVFCSSALPLATPAGNPPAIFTGKTKRELRRKTRILQDAFPGKVRFKCFSANELEPGLRDATKVLLATWQYSFGHRFLNTPQAHDRLEFFAKQGWLRIFVLYIEDLPCAYLIGQLYHGIFHCQHVGYDRNFAQFSVGTLLTAWAFETMAAAGVQRVDLGEDGQEHFRRMGCETSKQGTVHVYSRTFPGIRANLFFVLENAIRAGARRTFSMLPHKWLAGAA